MYNIIKICARKCSKIEAISMNSIHQSSIQRLLNMLGMSKKLNWAWGFGLASVNGKRRDLKSLFTHPHPHMQQYCQESCRVCVQLSTNHILIFHCAYDLINVGRMNTKFEIGNVNDGRRMSTMMTTEPLNTWICRVYANNGQQSIVTAFVKCNSNGC